ncbi:MAG: hypothetical protein GF350_05320 [Chitinivibrionales bacterium]|nr:hypothetical protein [Chitinivibrionales bacterium]
MNYDVKKAWYFNVAFDLSLAGYDLSRLRPVFAESTVYFSCVGNSRDSIVLDTEPDDSYYEYLSAEGIQYPRPLSGKAGGRGEFVGAPWGWNAEADERFSSLNVRTDHPPLDIVRRVNSRAFSFDFCRSCDYGIPGSNIFFESGPLLAFLHERAQYPCVVKPFHGNAGIGFIHLKTPQLSMQEKQRIVQLFASGTGGAVYEPWLDRTTDISTRLSVEKDGAITGISHHRTLNNSGGVFYGIILAPVDDQVGPWAEKLDFVAKSAGAALYKEGYYGPAGIDSFVYRTGTNCHALASCVEINSRTTMSLPAYSLREKLAPNSCCLFEFVPSKHYRQIKDYSTLSSLAYDPEKQHGVHIFTPLHLKTGAGFKTPGKTGFFIVAGSISELYGLDRQLRARFKSKSGAAG